jgi:hypothetical protein
MKLVSLALSVSPHEEKAKFAGIIYASYGDVVFDFPFKKEEDSR